MYFTICDSYKGHVHGNVVSMNVRHLLFGRPWEFDRHIHHDGFLNPPTVQLINRTFTIKASITVEPSSPLISVLFLQRSPLKVVMRNIGVVFILVTTPMSSLVFNFLSSSATGSVASSVLHTISLVPPTKDYVASHVLHMVSYVSHTIFSVAFHVLHIFSFMPPLWATVLLEFANVFPGYLYVGLPPLCDIPTSFLNYCDPSTMAEVHRQSSRPHQTQSNFFIEAIIWNDDEMFEHDVNLVTFLLLVSRCEYNAPLRCMDLWLQNAIYCDATPMNFIVFFWDSLVNRIKT